MRPAIVCLTICAALNAQAAEPAPPKKLFVDSVVASINDSTILQSKLFTTVAGPMRTAEARQGRDLTLREVDVLMRQDLMRLISRYQMAQAAKSFGQLKPDQIEQLLRSELDRDKEDRARDLGSYVALSEELERQGRTWQTYAQEQRIEKLHDFAKQFAVYERLQKQSTLYLTPRMLRETYNSQKDFFVHPAMAELALVTFKGSTAKADAEAASLKWSNGVWTAREIAADYDTATPLLKVRAKSLPKELKEFGLSGPVGNVSPPIARPDGSYHVAKIMIYIAERNGTFEDPAVQAEVRLIAQKQVIQEFEAQALERARQRTEFWIYRAGERIQPR